MTAKIATLIDTCQTNSISSLWSNSAGTYDADNGRYKLKIDTSYDSQFESSVAYDLTSSSIYIKLSPYTAPDAATFLSLQTSSAHNILFGYTGGNLSVYNVSTSKFNTTYDPVNHAWLRIRESSSTTYFDTSPDGRHWTNQYSIADSSLTYTPTSVYPIIFGGDYGSDPAGYSYVYAVNTQIPSVPTFTDGDSDIADFNELASLVHLLVSEDERPAWHFYKTGTQAITASTWTNPAYGTVAMDSDGVWDSGTNYGGALIVTQGYYVTEVCSGVESSATAESIAVRFMATAGANNPNHSSGSTVTYATQSGLCVATASEDTIYAFSGMCPWVLYPGDEIIAQLYSTINITAENNSAASYIEGRFVPNFTGYWLRPGVNEATDSDGT